MQHLHGPLGLALIVKRSAAVLALSGVLVACGGGGGAGDPNALVSNGNGVNGASVNGTLSGPGATADTATQVAATLARLTNVGVAGRTYYVANDGNDNADGLSLTTPFASIERALSAVGPGDTIEVRGGTYVPRGNGFPLNAAGTKDARIKIEAYNGEHVVFDATGKGYAVYVDAAAPYWIIEGIEMSGGSSYTIKIDAPNVNLVNSNLHGSSNDIIKLVQTSNDVVIYGNEIHHNNAGPGANAQGVDIVGADRVWLAHNYVHDTASIGMYAKGNARNIVFEYNRLENIHSRGIMLGQSTDANLLWDGNYETYDGVIRNNIIVNTDDACLATASSFNVKILNNSCIGAAKIYHGGIFVSNESVVGQAGTNVEIRNNIVVTDGRPAFKIGPAAMTDMATLTVDNNIYWSNGAPVVFLWDDTPGLANVGIDQWRATLHKDAASQVVDPKYTDPTYLTVANDSPAIDAGVESDWVRDDYRQAARPQGAHTDIGAYETR